MVPGNPMLCFNILKICLVLTEEKHKLQFGYYEIYVSFPLLKVAALMGAHTLGIAQTENSGYDGTWDETGRGKFRNKYYQLMLDQSVEWTNVVSLFLKEFA